MRHSNLKLRLSRLAGSVGTALLLGSIVSGCSDDLLTGQPSWLGESIYAELERRGNFTQTLKLIDAQSEDYASVLKKTGSRTLFVADDAAWDEFFKNNPWGVKSIEEMSVAQKRMLFKGNMIKSAYLVELLGNLPAVNSTAEPEEGSCMRRSSSVDLVDSIPVVLKKDFPLINPVRVEPNGGAQIDYWSRLRDKDSVLMLQDDQVPTMIHFMPKFMLYNGISSDDVEFLTNGEITSNTGAFINGKVIKEKDITCQNGYIHVMDGVPVPLDNMANVIANDPQFSIYKRLLDRFSYPELQTENFKRANNIQTDKDVYVRRYFNDHGTHGFNQRDVNDGGTKVTTLLPYDPGWNRFVYESSNRDITYQTDAAVMVVPTDEAMKKYLETDGKDLNERYAKAGPGETAWDNAPDEVVLPLLINTMLKNSTLKTAIPSMFESINNSASESMGVKKADIDRVLWACNGIIYKTNKVYVAPDYVSVFYPCVIRATEDLRMPYTVVNNDRQVQGGEGFYAYLTNMGSKYSYVIPSDKALQKYFDPVSYKRKAANGDPTAVLYSFYVNSDGKIAARPYKVDWTTLDDKGHGAVDENVARDVTLSNEANGNPTSSGDAFNHFKDIIYSSLSVGTFKPGQRFYHSKSGNPIIVDWEGDKLAGVAGSFQYERGYFVPVTETFDKSQDGNGTSYIIDEEPLMSTFVSPYMALQDESRSAQFGSFFSLVDGMDIIGEDDGAGHVTMDKALRILNNYNYTIYVPSNESVDELIASHQMPTWDDVSDVENVINNATDMTEEDEAYLKQQMENMKTIINNFVTYHIQDNALYVDGDEYDNAVFESACLDTTTNRYTRLYVTYNRGGKMQIRDACNNLRTVDEGTNNILARQYYFNNTNGQAANKLTAASQIYSSSYVVIHAIDKPLIPFVGCYYDPAEFQKVQEVLAKYPVQGETPAPVPSPLKRRMR